MRDYPATLRPEPGWRGVFTREQVWGAWPNGTRVVKVQQELGDGTPLGARGTVLGSMRHPARPDLLAYFIEWEALPRLAVAVMDWKLARVEAAR